MTQEELLDHEKYIDSMTQRDMAWLYRFASVGHVYFIGGTPLQKYFSERFKKLGGMTVRISKDIGWEK